MIFAAVCLWTVATVCGVGPEPFELRDGDRVVFVGGTFIERDQVYGYLETMLTAYWPDRNIVFRNLGWSGDNVWGEARARFGIPADGFQHLKDHIESIKPTVIFVNYGANESFAGMNGLSEFQAGLNRLLDMFASSAAPNARLVLIAPLWQQTLGPPLPDAKRHNEDVALYRDAIRSIAEQRDCRHLEILDGLRESTTDEYRQVSNNGIHLTPYGYWLAASETMAQLGLSSEPWAIELGADGKPSRTSRVTISAFEKLDGGMRFEAAASRLPFTLPHRQWESLRPKMEHSKQNGRFGSLAGLRAGDYSIRIDGQPAETRKTSGALDLENGTDQVERLRDAIIDKNRLYFHRWRPENETYLFGFRKHEQGQNAAEVPKFDPLVEEFESLIAQLRVPENHTYEILLVGR